jgi:hypothetical protein
LTIKGTLKFRMLKTREKEMNLEIQKKIGMTHLAPE